MYLATVHNWFWKRTGHRFSYEQQKHNYKSNDIYSLDCHVDCFLFTGCVFLLFTSFQDEIAVQSISINAPAGNAATAYAARAGGASDGKNSA